MKRLILLLAVLMMNCSPMQTKEVPGPQGPPGIQGEQGAQGPSGLAADTVNSRWVLFDSEGNQVEAMVGVVNCEVERFGIAECHQGHLIAVGDKLVNLDFDFFTGEIIPSAEYNQVEWLASPGPKFMASTCDSPAMYTCSTTNSTSSYDRVSNVISINDVFYYADHGDQVVQPSTMHVRRHDGSCSAYNPPEGTKFCNYRQVPKEVVNILPNPPYVARLVYK